MSRYDDSGPDNPLLAAMQSQASFAGKAKLGTWLIGILKFTIIDALRRSARDPVPVSSLSSEIDTRDLDRLFDAEGMWQSKPATWADPQGHLHQAEFLQVLELCLSKLPPNSARVFMLR
ncbi:MAG: RNA polymerase subunit sigma, partial [Gammaproteobacteria bacterium]